MFQAIKVFSPINNVWLACGNNSTKQICSKLQETADARHNLHVSHCDLHRKLHFKGDVALQRFNPNEQLHETLLLRLFTWLACYVAYLIIELG